MGFKRVFKNVEDTHDRIEIKTIILILKKKGSLHVPMHMHKRTRRKQMEFLSCYLLLVDLEMIF